MPQKERIKKLDRPMPAGMFEEDDKAFHVKTKCVTCPNCGTSWCYASVREFDTEMYCQNCFYEGRVTGQHNRH
jgi:hypothetical protein